MTLGQVSALLAVIAVVPYIYEIYKKGVRPERASWFVWTVLLTINLLAQNSSGAHDSIWLTIGDLIGTSIVFVIAIFKGTGGFTKFDIRCMLVAAIGVLMWVLSGSAIIALAGSLLADAMGSLPTIRKAYIDPNSEGWTTFSIIAFASFLAIIAAGYSPVAMAVPLYLMIANLAVLIAKYLGHKKETA